MSHSSTGIVITFLLVMFFFSYLYLHLFLLACVTTNVKPLWQNWVTSEEG